MTEDATFDDLPLRARKRALTRQRLVHALLEELKDHLLDEIPISLLAEKATISEATFFNYFPTKTDLLTHFVRLWSLRMQALARRIVTEQKSALRAIEELLLATAQEGSDTPNIMAEIIAYQARHNVVAPAEPIELAERLLLLPDEPEVESLSDRGLSAILPGLIEQAIENGELDCSTDPNNMLLAVSSIFFGVPLLVGRTSPDQVGNLYKTQLHLLWAGARQKRNAS